ncbi:MAG TPA: hypothetical protein VFQ86_14320 [Arachidicoccus soli]|uniref:LiaF transmembrane domain-containing protein n=1 Tax=Arachidicoccus soli TaxID=2341117 RepID=A0A386HKV5_9BACT|nr:hypothetical protein [Arachidicoccus soli]AYD46246.1 hypothetical protein D6B99_00580 [Arachidicoccus soli]HEU0228910.1 hypothetical protein [Arachidicoccus soli]
MENEEKKAETGSDYQASRFDKWNEFQMHKNHNNGLTGLIVIIAGILLLLSRLPQTEALFPAWLFDWPMLLVLIGVIAGVKHRFCGGGWLVPIILGVYFLLRDNNQIGDNMSVYALPALLILLGIFIIINRNRPRRCKVGMRRFDRRYHRFNKFENQYQDKRSKVSDNSSEDVIDINSVFGSSEKVMFTKTFKGGTINCAFGGGKINLTQADMEDKAILNVSVTFGGAEIIVPSNWHIQNELTAFMGGIEDKRRSIVGDIQNKTLILRGSIFCGGVEIMN